MEQRCIVNLSSRSLSEPQKSVLGRGLNFAPAPKRVPIANLVVTVEQGLRQISLSEAERVHQKVVDVLNGAKPPPSNLSPEEWLALRVLRQGEGLVILPADKGCSS